MNILALDDEEIALEGLVAAVRKVEPTAQIYSFNKPKEALEFCRTTPCDVALLDIQMRNMNGVELAKKVKGVNPNTNIIFTTGYSDYMKEAFDMYASGYVLKPVTPAKLKKELENLRHPVRLDSARKVRIQAFGNFEIFIDDNPIKFRYDLSKELLAYLVDRNGVLCANGEIMAVLWGDKISSSYFRSLIKDLKDVLGKVGCEDIIVQQRGKTGIARQNVECDYFDWLDGKAYAINLYHGEYMSQYSWGENTNASMMDAAFDIQATDIIRSCPKKRVRIQTIPHFAIWVDKKTLSLSGKRAELLALLTDRAETGLVVGDAIACLWPDRIKDEKTQTLYRVTFHQLMDELKAAGIEDIIRGEGKKKYLATELVDCDLYRILDGDFEEAKKYGGYYWEEYDWAEVRNAQITSIKAHLKYRINN